MILVRDPAGPVARPVASRATGWASAPSWVPAGALLHLDFTGGRYWYNGYQRPLSGLLLSGSTTPVFASGGLRCEDGDQFFFALPEEFDADGLTVVVHAAFPDNDTNQEFFDLHDPEGGTTEQFLGRWTGGNFKANIRHEDASVANVTTGSFASPVRLGASFDGTTLRMAANGTELGNDTATGIATGLTRIALGTTRSGSSTLDGTAYALTVWRAGMTQAGLEAITEPPDLFSTEFSEDFH